MARGEDGSAWRLPDELEREKAARGADGRLTPWGNHLDATFACVLESHHGPPAPPDVDTYPADESPYGIRGLAGNVRDWCVNRWSIDGPRVEDGRLQLDPKPPEDDDCRIIRGGAWGGTINQPLRPSASGAGRGLAGTSSACGWCGRSPPGDLR